MTKFVYLPLLLLFTLAATAEVLIHSVEQGDTLYSIARYYNVPLELVVAWNEISDPAVLEEGTSITIPDVYKVVKGDTLYSIARTHGITLDELKRLNHLSTNSILQGETLFIPQIYQKNGLARQDSASSETQDAARIQKIAAQETAIQAKEASPPLQRPQKLLLTNQKLSSSSLLPVQGNVSRRKGKLPGIVIESGSGSEVQAVSDGMVIYAGPHSSFGNVVLIQSSTRYIYVYAGQADVFVKVGDSIEAGKIIGTVGISPELNTPALYFSIWKDSRFIDAMYITQ